MGIRSVSLTINANLAWNIILGLIEAEAPELLGDKTVYQPKGHSSIFFLITTRIFLQIELNWTSCRGTKDGQKTPDNAEEICKETCFRFVYTVRREGISKYLIVKMDQTSVLLVPGGQDNTYEIKGAKQVLIHGKEEKRALTTVLFIDLKGQVLPIQCVWKGVVSARLHTPVASRKVTERGHRFALNRRIHWSSLETTKAWIAEILLVHQKKMFRIHDLSLDSKEILYLDCWIIHRSKEFCE